MLKQLVEYLNSAQAAVLAAFFIALITAGFKYLKPLWQKKISTEKNTHVKQALEIGLKFANAIVPEMAVLQRLSKTDRKKEAVRFVNAQLTANGFTMDIQTIEALVEQAYQAYKVSGGDKHFAKVTPAPKTVEESDQNA